MANKFYVVEGVDSAGKTTICEKLARENCWKYISTPIGLFKKHMRRIEKMGDAYLSFIYFLGAVFNTSYLIKKEIKKRKTVICDRYFPTLLVYSRATNLIQHFVNLKKLPILKPTKILHLYVDYKKIKKRLSRKVNLSIDESMILKNKQFYDNLIKEYREECDIEVNATNLTVNKLAKRIQKILK